MATAIQTSPIRQLVDLFDSVLDESLVIAIANDYDVSTAAGYSTACAVLQSLAQDANFEESSGFDPSAVHRLLEEDEDGRVVDIERSTSTGSRNSKQANGPESTGPGNATASILSSAEFMLPDEEFSKSGMLETDLLQLQDLFPDLQSWDIRHALLEANGVVAIALDTLLSVQYLQSVTAQETTLGALSIAGDTKNEALGGNRSVFGYDATTTTNGETGMGSPKMVKTPASIVYISERLNMSAEEVSIIYAENGNSKVATILGILDQFLIQREAEPPTTLEKNVIDDLKQKYRNTPDEYLQVIVQITGPDSTYAAELASQVNAYFSKRSMNQKLKLNYRLTPLPHEDLEGSMGTVTDTWAEGRSPRRATTISTSSTGKDLNRALQISNSLQRQKQDAIASAASLHRRGASSPLYRQAAGYYAQQAREHARRAQEATSTAADILVDQQSTGRTVDLHGVSVQDGVRIARQRALNWWKGLRGSREGPLSDQSLTIITGLGRHNASGISPLRQAVAAALTRDGWKYTVETGRFVISGRGK
ncbi:hypothetical protein GGI43DRAFT_391929 [Trichoderma evansii]